jgi:hypothetical protein
MNKGTVVGFSVVADVLDFTGIGQIFYIVDFVIIIIHLLYAGPRALLGILDMIPGVGFLPIYTFLALTYKSKG